MTNSIAIIGGGAAGIFAALGAKAAAVRNGSELHVVLLERNPRLGIKILISGGGKCNITHDGPIKELLEEGFLVPKERRFLRGAIHRYTNADILTLLKKNGVDYFARENGRIFPRSNRAEDVLEAFEAELREANVEVQTRAHVTRLERIANGWSISTSNDMIQSAAIILATGGISYSKVGTTGDGIRYAEQLGHSIAPLLPALAPLYTNPVPNSELAGVALRDAEVYIVRDSKIRVRKKGDVLLTHKGISGPAALDISRNAVLEMKEGICSVEINLMGISIEKINDLLRTTQVERSTQLIKTWLEEVLPNRLVPSVLAKSEIALDRRWNNLTRDERSRLAGILYRYPVGRLREIPLERGEVTAGGVELSEVDRNTMMSKKQDGLFIAGEMLDMAGEIGGYNLQAAYSSGWLAGESAAAYVLTK